MDVRIEPRPLAGIVAAIPSKSMAHRLLICAALAQGITDLELPSGSEDIKATIRCIRALGATVGRTRTGLRVVPVTVGGVRRRAKLDVGESGSTLRFLLPVAAALGRGASFVGQGRLAERPLAPLDGQLIEHGASLSAPGSFPLKLGGRLAAGTFRLPGNVSSQFVSGLLLAAPLLESDTKIIVSEPVESRGYIDLTVSALAAFGVTVIQRHGIDQGNPCRIYTISGNEQLVSPGACVVEGDWSNAAFWLAAGALDREPLSVRGLDPFSKQGDRAVMAALALLGARVRRGSDQVSVMRESSHGARIDLSDIPDLAAPLAAVAATASGTTQLTGASRLRLKESDRLSTICQTLTSMGGTAHVEEDSLVIEGVSALTGGVVDAARDHRIAMMAAICGAYATGPTIIRGAECVTKSYPSFFNDFRSLGGIVRTREV